MEEHMAGPPNVSIFVSSRDGNATRFITNVFFGENYFFEVRMGPDFPYKTSNS